MKKNQNVGPKYLTLDVFEKSMRSIARSFDSVNKNFEKVFEKLDQHSKILDQHSKAFEIVLKEMVGFREEAKEHRLAMSSMNHTDIAQQRKIEGLELRIEKLEYKLK